MASDRIVIDVIDNGGQWTHREWRMLRYLGVDTQILPNNIQASDLRKLDGLILSGGAARVGLTGELGNCGEYLELDIPILGICAGHQFMARHYGGNAGEAPKPEFGAASISLVNGGGPLFEGTPDKQTVWESHNDEVSELPPGFTIIAHSESCEVQGMQNESLDRFGLQFHPEVNDTEYGSAIFENFVELCKRGRTAS
jgi:GMP synthase (glutamine-hydrolysing)